MTRFEHALCADGHPADSFNAEWWELVQRYQGVERPSRRDESTADALTKTHINDDPGQYYDYALSSRSASRCTSTSRGEILGQDPHDTD